MNSFKQMATTVPNNEIRLQDYQRRLFLHTTAKREGLNARFPMPIMKMAKAAK